MPSLAESQSRFINCLQMGPDHLPTELFSESADRALLGMKAHANTISHARLVALENAYPKLYDHMGHEEFHAISRDYIEQDHILLCDMNEIAADFPAYLEKKAYGPSEIDLAKIEWAWLESYNSAESDPLALEDIATLDEESLLSFPIGKHPSMRIIAMNGPLSPMLQELGDMTPYALMVARPEAQVLFHPLDNIECEIAEKVEKVSTLGNLLEQTIELVDKTANAGEGAEQAMPHLIKLIQAGALTKRQDLGGN